MTIDTARLRAHLNDPRALCEALGLLGDRRNWKRQTRGVTVRCPWHDEHTPSCSVTVGEQGTVRASCFGCGASADALGLVAAIYRLDVRRDYAEVARVACQIAGLDPDALGDAPPPPAQRLPPEPPRLDDDTFDAIAEVIARECPVDREPEVRAYLSERALYDAGAPVFAALPADATRVVRAIVAAVGEDAWFRSGLASERGGFLFPSHRLVIFWRGEGTEGLVQTVQRRLVRAPRDKSEPKYVFATRRQPRLPYGLESTEALGPGGEVWFCEGALDAIALRSMLAAEGTDALALGVPGVSAWHRSWARFAAGRVAVVALDADAAGESLVVAMARDLLDAGAVEVRRATPDGCKDWCDALASRRVAA